MKTFTVARSRRSRIFSPLPQRARVTFVRRPPFRSTPSNRHSPRSTACFKRADHVVPILGRSLPAHSEQRTPAIRAAPSDQRQRARQSCGWLCISSMVLTNPACHRPKSPLYLFTFRSRLRGVRNRHGRGGRDAVDAAVSGVMRVAGRTKVCERSASRGRTVPSRSGKSCGPGAPMQALSRRKQFC